MIDNNYGIELYHHGVKGMKWGVRRKLGDAISKHRETRRAIKEQYKAIRKDPNSYSVQERLTWNTRKLSKATAKRMVKKGEDFDTAKKKVKRNSIITSATILTAQLALQHPKVQKLMSQSATKIMQKAADKYMDIRYDPKHRYNTEIRDSLGVHVTFMNTPFKDLTNAIARR